jgi:hypothetical protein
MDSRTDSDKGEDEYLKSGVMVEEKKDNLPVTEAVQFHDQMRTTDTVVQRIALPEAPQ